MYRRILALCLAAGATTQALAQIPGSQGNTPVDAPTEGFLQTFDIGGDPAGIVATPASQNGSLISLSVPSGPPTDFDQWSVSNGTINASCPTGFNCAVIASDDGFLQKNVQDAADGTTFIQTIIASDNATGTFSDESFVWQRDPALNTSEATGIADKQTIQFAQTTETADSRFDATTELHIGWAEVANTPNIEVSQGVTEVSRSKGFGSGFVEGNFQSTAEIAINSDGNGEQTGLRMAFDQTVEEPGQFMRSGDLNDDGNRKDNVHSTSGNFAEIDTQVFALRRLAGDQVTSSGSASLPGAGRVSWQAGDDLRAYMVANAFHHSRTTQDGGSGVSLQNTKDDKPGYQTVTMNMVGYDNLSESAPGINSFRYATTQPVGWATDPFGPAPDVPRPTGLAGTGKDNINVGRRGPAPTIVSGLFTPTPTGSKATGEGLPFSLGNWSVTDGEITADCPPGASCAVNIAGAGMRQQAITASDGERYIQSIITDSDATGDASSVPFANESFVRQGGGQTSITQVNGAPVLTTMTDPAASGIITRQSTHDDMAAPSAVDTSFDTDTTIRIGWAATSDTPNVEISQQWEERFANSGGRVSSGFDYRSNEDAAGNTTGFALDLVYNGINTIGAFNGENFGNESTVDNFILQTRSGDMLTSSGSDSRCIAARNPERCQSFSWQPGDTITAARTNVRGIRGSDFTWLKEDNLSDNVRPSIEYRRKDGDLGLGTFIDGGSSNSNLGFIDDDGGGGGK